MIYIFFNFLISSQIIELASVWEELVIYTAPLISMIHIHCAIDITVSKVLPQLIPEKCVIQ